MKYQVQENCLTIYLPREVDHHNAEEMKREADAVIVVGAANSSNSQRLREVAGAARPSRSITSGSGPTKIRPAASQAAAKSAFSARKP